MLSLSVKQMSIYAPGISPVSTSPQVNPQLGRNGDSCQTVTEYGWRQIYNYCVNVAATDFESLEIS